MRYCVRVCVCACLREQDGERVSERRAALQGSLLLCLSSEACACVCVCVCVHGGATDVRHIVIRRGVRRRCIGVTDGRRSRERRKQHRCEAGCKKSSGVHTRRHLHGCRRWRELVRRVGIGWGWRVWSRRRRGRGVRGK
jgi:hypothetical protein